MRASTAYFAGAGTVMAAIVIGFGGSLLFANIVSPTAPKPELTKLDQRMSQQPIQVAARRKRSRTLRLPTLLPRRRWRRLRRPRRPPLRRVTRNPVPQTPFRLRRRQSRRRLPRSLLLLRRHHRS